MTGTKRTRISRTPIAGVVTPQIVTAFRHARKLKKQAHRSPVHQKLACDAEIAVDHMLGTKLWQISIFLDELFTADEPPAYILEHGRAADWEHTRELRQRLVEADIELRRQERAAREQPASS